MHHDKKYMCNCLKMKDLSPKETIQNGGRSAKLVLYAAFVFVAMQSLLYDYMTNRR